MLGIGLTAMLRVPDFPGELRERAGTLALSPDAIEPMLDELLGHLGQWIVASAESASRAVRERDASLGRPVRWAGGSGIGAGLDEDAGCLWRARPRRWRSTPARSTWRPDQHLHASV